MDKKNRNRLSAGMLTAASCIILVRFLPPEGMWGLAGKMLTFAWMVISGLLFLAVGIKSIGKEKAFMLFFGIFLIVTGIKISIGVGRDLSGTPKQAIFTECRVFDRYTARGFSQGCILSGRQEDGKRIEFRISPETGRYIQEQSVDRMKITYYENSKVYIDGWET